MGIAGSALTSVEESEALNLPNSQPFVCSLFIGPNSESDTEPDLTPSITTSDDLIASAQSVYGFDYCDEESRVGEMSKVLLPNGIMNAESMDMVLNDGNFLFGNVASFVFSAKFYVMVALSIFVSSMMFVLIKCNVLRRKWTQKKKNKITTTTYGTVA